MKTDNVTVAPRDSLKSRLFRGGAWLGAGSATEQVSRFGRNMILTRLLAPEAFGTMAIILSAASIIQSLTEVGVREALIQNPNGEKEDYIGAAWWLAFGRAAGVYLLLFLGAPFVARFYASPQLTALLRVATLGLVFEGAISTKAYVAMKQMKFSRWAIINHGGAILGVATTLVLSFFLRNIWALVLGACSESAAKCLFSYIVCPYLPPLGWQRAAIRDLLHFSKGVFGLPILNLIFIRADIFVLAKLFSSADLGLYAMAVYLVQAPAGFLMNLLGQTLLPTFAHVREDHTRTSRILVRITSVLAWAGIPVLVFIFFCGRSLLTLAYGQRYGSAATPLILASVVALLNVINGPITTVFYAKGLPQLHRRCVVILASTMILLIYPLVRQFGFMGGQLTALVAIVAGLSFQVARVRHLVGLELREYTSTFVLSGIVSLSAVAICLCAQQFANLAGPVPNIVSGIVACTIAYFVSAGVALRGNLKGVFGQIHMGR